MGDLGLLGVRYPREYGGGGGDWGHAIVLAEEMARCGAGGIGMGVGVQAEMATPPILKFGTEEQKRRYLVPAIKGEKIFCLGITEPGAGSDVAGIRTTARRVSDAQGDGWVLNGTKLFITNGVHADLYFIAAKTPGSADSARHAMSMFIVEKGTPGFSVGRALKKTGWLSSDTAELVLDNVRLPADALLGEENQGFYSIMRNFQNERLVLSGMAVGEATEGLRLTREYVKNRKAFGGVLWDMQTIRQRLSMLEAKVEAARQLYYHTAWRMSRDLDSVREVSMLKAYSAELVNEVMYDCQQFHGGFGYIQESAIERMVRDARVLSIGGGATEVMLEEVAKRSDERR
jgi:acyl-CoA dehydrogenase